MISSSNYEQFRSDREQDTTMMPYVVINPTCAPLRLFMEISSEGKTWAELETMYHYVCYILFINNKVRKSKENVGSSRLWSV